MTSFQNKMRREMVRALVGRAITCPNTGEVLDARTCVVLLDRYGDPGAVISQQGWRNVVNTRGGVERIAEVGWTVDQDTVETPIAEPEAS